MNLNKALEFFNLDKKFLIAHDYDVDGICSAAIIMYDLKIKNKNFENLADRFQEKNEKLIEFSKEFKSVIFLDVSKISFENLLNFKNVLILDHHEVENYGNNIFYINPRIDNKDIYIPTSYIAQKILNFKETLWVSACGIVGDQGFKYCKDILKNFKINEKNWKRTRIGKIVRIIDAVRVIKGKEGSKKLAKYIFENIDDMNKIFRFEKYYKIYNKEIERILTDFNKNKIENKHVVFYEVKSKYPFASTIATILSNKIKGKIIAIAQKYEDYKVSLRSNIIDLNNLCKEILKDLNGFGGGHRQAAAATIKDEESYKIFVDRLINLKP